MPSGLRVDVQWSDPSRPREAAYRELSQSGRTRFCISDSATRDRRNQTSDEPPFIASPRQLGGSGSLRGSSKNNEQLSRCPNDGIRATAGNRAIGRQIPPTGRGTTGFSGAYSFRIRRALEFPRSELPLKPATKKDTRTTSVDSTRSIGFGSQTKRRMKAPRSLRSVRERSPAGNHRTITPRENLETKWRVFGV